MKDLGLMPRTSSLRSGGSLEKRGSRTIDRALSTSRIAHYRMAGCLLTKRSIFGLAGIVSIVFSVGYKRYA